MKKITFENDWICYEKGKKEQAIEVTIPHDAMLMDNKSENSPGGANTGWYDAKDYIYEKIFFVAESDKEYTMFLEFEGVHHKATVYINNMKVAYQDYGYLGFTIELDDLINYGQENQIRIEVTGTDQPNSRWYTGTGIYRPVWQYKLPKSHIELDGIKITTLDYKTPEIKIDIELQRLNSLSEPSKVLIEIIDKEKVFASAENEIVCQPSACDLNFKTSFKIELKNANLWSPEEPYRYCCRVTYGEDIREICFGIRVVECSASKGFCINGKRVILRGACIHHDNGLLGACAYDFAEKRKVRLLKQGGYNAIRSAHNPCSKALLDACDEQGLLVVDEYVDVWYIHKTKYDYAGNVEQNYHEDIKKIVDKDYNHPSVIMYSTGNEVSETSQNKGVEFCAELTRRFHELDSTRYVTCGINIFFNFLYALGFGVYSDKKADQAVKNTKKKRAVGSEFFNKLAGLMGADFMKFGATLYPCDVKTRNAFQAMDIAGYNYGILRYLGDLKKYPDRMILGSETFCSDAYRFWETAKKNPGIIGDFVWAGMDYLGETGIGAWEYPEYAPRMDHGLGWVSAGSGRIDLTGKELSEMKYSRVAFEMEEIGLGVIPVAFADKKHSSSAWKLTNAIESWSWEGCEGMKTNVEVYARAAFVSLYINNICVGTKKIKNDCRTVFSVNYQNGELKAISYDKKMQKIAETSLNTAGKDTILTLLPENIVVKKETDICYVRLQYTDSKGTVKPLVRGDIRIEVSGGKLLGIGSACPFYTKSYLDDTTDTYYGEALAIIKPSETGKMIVNASSVFGFAEVGIEVL
ncbi:MAG: glycoside hydrolase family 2 TIM barrel-domain containing protein [Lachnospiraceae bacterium]|nr:glycoside hydrolase family 2 TIM barrel-domain containing protein [Lachnospiraceae bacterium]